MMGMQNILLIGVLFLHNWRIDTAPQVVVSGSRSNLAMVIYDEVRAYLRDQLCDQICVQSPEWNNQQVEGVKSRWQERKLTWTIY